MSTSVPPKRSRRPGPSADGTGQASDLERRMRSLEQEVDALRRANRGLHRTNQALHNEIKALRAERRRQAEAFRHVVNSTSWRLTEPLRRLTMLLRGQISLAQLAPRRAGKRAAPLVDKIADKSRRRTVERRNPSPALLPLAGALSVPGEHAHSPPPSLDIVVSVVIPVYNPGAEFHWLLRKLLGQKGLRRVEVVVVDSGSHDGAPDMAEAMGCRVIRIPNSEFSHSHARNLGADNASGDLLLFTVQDAYPVGDYWLRVMAGALLGDQDLSAVSCAEFPRADSEILYNAAIDTHYRFLGCHDGDRVGVFKGDDQQALRTQGQLSDVACLIRAETFAEYRYEGDYAEDLLLGIRLIQDGRRIAMLSSTRVIHSHNRPARYHLKRTFVDVLFLTQIFPDFLPPFAESVETAVAVAARLKATFDNWRPSAGRLARDVADEAVALARAQQWKGAGPAATSFDLPVLDIWIAEHVLAGGRIDESEAEQLLNMTVERLDALAVFVGSVYGEADQALADEIAVAARKTVAAVLGAQLAFVYLNTPRSAPGEAGARLEALKALMLAGV